MRAGTALRREGLCERERLDASATLIYPNFCTESPTRNLLETFEMRRGWCLTALSFRPEGEGASSLPMAAQADSHPTAVTP